MKEIIDFGEFEIIVLDRNAFIDFADGTLMRSIAASAWDAACQTAANEINSVHFGIKAETWDNKNIGMCLVAHRDDDIPGVYDAKTAKLYIHRHKLPTILRLPAIVGAMLAHFIDYEVTTGITNFTERAAEFSERPHTHKD